MKKNTLYISIAAYLALLIQTPGRFVYGITIMLELLLLVIVGTLVSSLVKKIQMEELTSLLVITSLVSFSILFQQILIITYPEIALTLGYILYFPIISIILLNNILIFNDAKLPQKLLINLKNVSFCVSGGLLFFLFRDIAGYGTFTFFGKNSHIYEKIIFNSNQIGLFSFVASIPGSLLFSGILLFVYVLVSNKMKILKNAEKQK